ncbi:hypothetical protein LA080_009866 [Diaporthe eres]|nr:hypothetical protein LA080_009866 [Diaporthe eres]
MPPARTHPYVEAGQCTASGTPCAATLADTEKEGKIWFMHTHPFFILSPDRLLASVTAPGALQNDGRPISLIPKNLLLHPGTVPLFTIRHPVLLVPSSIRGIKKAETGDTRASFIIGTSLGFSREIYDWYMTSADFNQSLGERLGLDPALVAVSWPKTTEDEQKLMHPVLLRMQETLVKSQGLDASRAARNVDLTEERARWKEEFSDEEVMLMEEIIAHITPHYEYFRERHFVPSSRN